jgi:cytochrome c peroxidase
MKKVIFFLAAITAACIFSGMSKSHGPNDYFNFYQSQIDAFDAANQELIGYVEKLPSINGSNAGEIKEKIWEVRTKMKALDFWLRYLEPVAYMKINGPLPVEWENEVFEKFEKPYKREGAGLSLAELYLDERTPGKDTLLKLLRQPHEALATFRADSITKFLQKPAHFFFANRLFLLNLAAIYTTGFECPDTTRVIPELSSMLKNVRDIYDAFLQRFPGDTIISSYMTKYAAMQQFVDGQGKTPAMFDHFRFIKDHVNPLFGINQQLIHRFRAISMNYNDYSLNNNCYSIFDKTLYKGQNEKGLYIVVDDSAELNGIREIGRLLFYDPILSGNGKRSCASCHKPTEYFTDTTVRTNLQFDGASRLPRNTPSLINAVYNHLLMLDGRHISLQNQAQDVMTNPVEMGCNAEEIVSNVMSCNTYKKAFQHFVKLTPNYPEMSLEHIVSAITLYYAGFSKYNAPFDLAMNNRENIDKEVITGFNLFMSKAQCATCHFVPQFNGVKPPYISSEFEVLGVPADPAYHKLSSDSGRYVINPAIETLHAFRTNTVRNTSFTKPYMHNGVFNTMDEVLDFYDTGGGIGHGFSNENQTLSSDSLHLSDGEKKALKAFMRSLDEKVVFQDAPGSLPATKLEKYKDRLPSGVY